MRKVLKPVIMTLLVLCMGFGVLSTHAAATWKDGSYVVESERDEKNSYFKLLLTVSDGAVSSIDFQQWNKSNRLDRDSLKKVPIPDLQVSMGLILDEVEYYDAQLKQTKDATVIEKYSAPNEGVYEAVQALWIKVIEQAQTGGSDSNTATAATEDTTTSTVANTTETTTAEKTTEATTTTSKVTPTTIAAQDTDKGGLGTPAIVGIVIGGVVVIGGGVALIYFLKIRKTR